MGKKWEKDPDVRFFTFPVELLQKAFTDIEGVCNDAIEYAVYVRCKDYDETPDDALRFFGIPIEGDVDEYFKNSKKLYDRFKRPVLVSVNKETILDFWNNPKTEFEIAVFCAFCGIRSIIGTKDWFKTTNGLLIARMFGCRSESEFKELEKKPPYYVAHFSTDQQIRSQLTEKIIRKELAIPKRGWHLRYFGGNKEIHVRGFYVSFKVGVEVLILHAASNRKSTLLRQQQQEQKQIIESVMRQIQGK